MNELHLPWLELSVIVPLIGAGWVFLSRQVPEKARRYCLIFSTLTLLIAVGAWIDFHNLRSSQAYYPLWSQTGNTQAVVFVIDEINAPLLPLASLLYLLTSLATTRTKIRRYSFGWSMVAEAILMATLACGAPWGIITLLALGTIPPYLELCSRRKPTRVYVLHMGLFIVLMTLGWALVQWEGERPVHSILAVSLLMAAVLIRSGIVPVHCWMTDLFEHATFGTSLLFVTPMVGAYGAVRLLLPIAPDWALRSIAIISLITAVYAAGMALVQKEARRFFCYLFLSHSSLVLVGLEIATPIGLTGALCVWLSVGLALSGFGLTLRAVESRIGRVSLAGFHGLYEHTPALAAFFLLTGLASIGFPGTIGFVGTELLIEGAVGVYPYVGMAVVFAAALNSIAVVHAYFRVFTGARHQASVSIASRPSERIAVLALTVLIIGGGLLPQPGVASRYHAATEIVAARKILADPKSVGPANHLVEVSRLETLLLQTK